MDEKEIKKEMDRLISVLEKANYQYYVLGRPELTDNEYDSLLEKLKRLEEKYPHLAREDSPTKRVGSDLASDFPEVEHSIPVLSLDKAYSTLDVRAWIDRIRKTETGDFAITAEEKIDGISLVLYYRNGLLSQAVTRGNGRKGNDITANAKTIRQIPLSIPVQEEVIVRGEVYLPVRFFDEINKKMEVPYANPRNLAGGVLRRIKSSEVAAVPLHFFAYEAIFDSAPDSYSDILNLLREWKFSVNDNFFRADTSLGYDKLFSAIEEFIKKETERRDYLDYQIDGLVFKLDSISMRERLGHTEHHPRWAIAYKFEAPQAVTELLRIDVQVGRTGRLTPVARLKPVELSGSVISNVTLHNQDYVQALELSPGDIVGISKRGDVIPAIEKVVEKAENSPPVWSMPQTCPVCGSQVEKKGSHHFCSNFDCPAQIKGRLKFFVSPRQMDIAVLGNETIEYLVDKGHIKNISDLYYFDYTVLISEQGFGEKKISQIIKGIEDSKKLPFSRLLIALGIPDIGPSVVKALVDNNLADIDELKKIAEERDITRLTAIEGVGESTANQLIKWFSDERFLSELESLQKAGFSLREKPEEKKDGIFSGQTWCITGSFNNFNPRSKAQKLIEDNGGKVTSTVSGKTTHLLAGESAGSKLAKARELGIKIVTEDEFISMLDSVKNSDKNKNQQPELF
ncbi:NAD-dependent DNA ligase LigA [Spirochaetia bacterium 38H-sp]|uniref:DNA ligase n=1 Tax=Rarispira pelagica TaxID=3141764 RepID=A0ABU9UBB1_9SPIR